ncbi:hypothetical protein ONZ51_g13146 [Trametes cubensis]|uniref:Uncharacterized protein n=1 Tax=Trametes cubensis TaxID=1111947 RepID=A0AAD7TH32_9APHY|nr:hypothetical protein ONZ51_g13146 [Trametes cubensis]
MRLFAIGSRTIASRASLFPPVPSPSSPPLTTFVDVARSPSISPFLSLHWRVLDRDGSFYRHISAGVHDEWERSSQQARLNLFSPRLIDARAPLSTIPSPAPFLRLRSYLSASLLAIALTIVGRHHMKVRRSASVAERLRKYRFEAATLLRYPFTRSAQSLFDLVWSLSATAAVWLPLYDLAAVLFP